MSQPLTLNKKANNVLIRFMIGWNQKILSRPWWLLLFVLVACGLTLKYSLDNLSINTNTADMISTEVPFQQKRLRLERAFPQDVNDILLVVEGDTPERTAQAVAQLGERLRADKQFIKAVYIPGEEAFFTQNGLLFLDLDELENLSAQLASAQPFIGRLAEDNSLDGLFGILETALKTSADDLPLDLDPLLKKIQRSVQAVQEGKPYQLSWQQLMLEGKTKLGTTQRFILATPILDFSAVLPAEKPIQLIHGLIAGLHDDRLPDVRVRMTGEVVLEHEEVQAVGQSTAIASIASLILVCATLLVAYRSIKLMFATFFTLSVGLIFSMGFATAAIGHLNLISIAFAVLFIGMGDAYSSHFCLRYRELLQRNMTPREALVRTMTSTASSLLLCTLTAAIGLYAFIPTNYSGVSELGIIAGTSMFIALVTTFTILPALLKIMPLRPVSTWRTEASAKKTSAVLQNWPLRYAPLIRGVTLVLALLSFGLLFQIKIDFNPINLRDPNSDAVKTFKSLLSSKDTSPMTLASLAGSETETFAKKARFEQLESVDKVTTIFDFIPDHQEEKLAIIEDLALILGPQLDRFPPPQMGKASVETIEKFTQAVNDSLSKKTTDAQTETLTALRDQLDQFLATIKAADDMTRRDLLEKLEFSLLSALPKMIKDLQSSLQAHPVGLKDLPQSLSERWLSKYGIYRIQIFPKKDLNDLANLREFIHEAQRVDPDVTDLPVTYLESMQEVIKAFQQAFGTALIAITILLLIILRNIRDTLLVLLPLLLSSLFTAAATVILDIPFNFANIIALPLLFGLGVDSGIHMAHRLHYLNADDQSLFSASEAKGVFYGTLTTIFSFMSLAFTSHVGMATMGELLAIGLLLTLLCALVILPAFSEWGKRSAQLRA